MQKNLHNNGYIVLSSQLKEKRPIGEYLMEIPLQGFTPKDLDKIKIKVNKNRIVTQVGMMVTLYLENAYKKQCGLAVGQCIEEYMALARPHLKHYGGKKLRVRKFSQTPIQLLAEMIEPLNERQFSENIITRLETDEESSPYNVETLFDRKRSYKQIGYLSATFPLAFLEEQPCGFFQYDLMPLIKPS